MDTKHLVGTRLTAEEMEALKRLAREDQRSVSSLLRLIVRRHIKGAA